MEDVILKNWSNDAEGTDFSITNTARITISRGSNRHNNLATLNANWVLTDAGGAPETGSTESEKRTSLGSAAKVKVEKCKRDHYFAAYTHSHTRTPAAHLFSYHIRTQSISGIVAAATDHCEATARRPNHQTETREKRSHSNTVVWNRSDPTVMRKMLEWECGNIKQRYSFYNNLNWTSASMMTA